MLAEFMEELNNENEKVEIIESDDNLEPLNQEKETLDEETLDENDVVVSDNNEFKTEAFFEKYKKDFLETEPGQDFKLFLEMQKESGSEVFDLDFFINCKIKYRSLKTIVIDATMDDLALGKNNKFYLLKPLVKSEYGEFMREYGSREMYPDEFITFTLKKCLVFPEDYNEEDIELMPVGTLQAIYTNCIQLSDLNTTFKIIEV